MLLSHFYKQLVPTHCGLCNSRQANSLCHACIVELSSLSCAYQCIMCANPSHTWLCKSCLINRPCFDSTVCLGYLHSRLFPAIKKFDQSGAIELLPTIVDAWCFLGKRQASPLDFLIPMPEYHQMVCKRGFSSSLELAKALGKLHKIELLKNCIGLTMPNSENCKLSNKFSIFPKSSDSGFLEDKRVGIVSCYMSAEKDFNQIALLLKTIGVYWVSNWIILRDIRKEIS
ncbi:MAG: hypothetical protein WCK52_07100 [Betaproteobacteria bacterium]